MCVLDNCVFITVTYCLGQRLRGLTAVCSSSNPSILYSMAKLVSAFWAGRLTARIGYLGVGNVVAWCCSTVLKVAELLQ